MGFCCPKRAREPLIASRFLESWSLTFAGSWWIASRGTRFTVSWVEFSKRVTCGHSPSEVGPAWTCGLELTRADRSASALSDAKLLIAGQGAPGNAALPDTRIRYGCIPP